MAGPSDFMFGNAPGAASYAAPLLNFGTVGSLPQDFQQGQQYQRERALQTAFKDGLPRLPDGSIDIRSMSDTLARLGGAQTAMPLVQTQMQMDAARQMSDAANGQPPGMPPATPQAQPAAAGPANITGKAPGDTAAPTLRTMVSEHYGGNVDSSTRIANMAKLLRVDPDAPLTPEMQSRISRGLAQRATAPGETAGAGASLGGSPAPVSDTDTSPPFAPTSSREVASASKPNNIGPSEGLLPGDSPAALEAGRAEVRRMQNAATAYANLNKPGAEGLQKRAGTREAELKAMEERLSKAAQRPADIREAGIKKQQELDAVHYDRLYGGLAAQGVTGEQMMQDATNARALLQHPDMYTGTGAELVNTGKKVLGALGIANPEGAAPLEALAKTKAAAIQNQINDLKAFTTELGGTSARIFAPQIALMQQAAQSTDTSLAGNLYLTTVQQRAGKLFAEVSQMANQYKQDHGTLDAKFERQMADYVRAHPLMRAAERNNPILLSKREFATPQDALAHGAKPGEIIRTPNGDYVQLKAPAR